jgi:cyclase
MDFERVTQVCKITRLPVIASGGAASLEDCLQAVSSGASAVAAGALFQFTQITPRQVRDYLSEHGISTRVLG